MRFRPPLLVGILLGTAALAAVLTYEAYDAARSHRAVAERVLRDYARLAAFRLIEGGRVDLQAVTLRAFAPVLSLDARTLAAHPPGPEILMPTAERAVEGCAGGRPDLLRYYFRVDFRDRSVVTRSPAGASPSAAPDAAVRRAVADTVAAYAPMWPEGELEFSGTPFFRTVDGESRMLLYAMTYDAHGRPLLAYGLETCLSALHAPRFARVMKMYPLLPPTLTGSVPSESLLSATVSDSMGHVVYRSTPQYASPFVGTYPSPTRLTLGSRVAIRPEAADRLVIGGLPRSRLPLLLGVLALTLALVAMALLQLRRERELARMRADFVSGVSHELRTPLAQIRMFGETLRLGRVRSEEERRRSLEIIDQEARRLTHLVENVLHFSRTERRTARLSREPTELASHVAESVELFAPIAQSRRVLLHTMLEEGLVASVDRSALRQVLTNLLDNAVKYGPAGQTVTVGLTRADAADPSLRSWQAGDDRARIWVDDRGPGIAPRERERVWAPFYRLERDAESAVAGSGIGLAVVRELVALHGGRTWVEEAPGGGARFVVELPGLGTRDSGLEETSRSRLRSDEPFTSPESRVPSPDE